MTDQNKPTVEKREKIENLELNKETLQDLTEGQSEAARGGVAGGHQPDTEWITCSMNTCG